MSNYRPLSLLSVPSKILESCVADMIAKHVFSENEAFVTDNQWAYPTKREDRQSYCSFTRLKLGDEQSITN